MNNLWQFDPDLDQPDQAIVGFEVVGTDEPVGKLTEAIHDADLSFLVVDVGRLMSHKRVAIPAGLVKQINTQTQKVFLRVDKDAVRNAPDYADDWQADQQWQATAQAFAPEPTG